MFNDPNFSFVDSWETDGPRRRWLRKYQGTLRATARGAGWGYVAEQLEARGWSEFFGGPALDGVRLAREMATIAHRSRRAGRRRQDLEATIAAAVKSALTEVAVDLVDRPVSIVAPAASPPSPARGAFAAAAADMAARPRRTFLPDRPASRVLLTDADTPDAVTTPATANLKKDQAHE